MTKLFPVLLLIPFFALAQNYTRTIDLGIPKSGMEPKSINFSTDAIYLDEKKCFNYVKKNDIVINNEMAPNYFEIISLDNTTLFSGIIKKSENGNFESTITFHPIKKVYKNSKIIGRNDLILNLSSNQVLNNNCSLNIKNLELFYEKSNENN